MPYNVISLFSGAMGLDIGLERTNHFRVVASIEKEPAFCDTIRANKAAGRLDPNLAIFEGDISNIPPEAVMEATGIGPGELDLLVGGPPCQSFSTAGRRGTVQDPRGTLLWQFLRYVEAFRPRFFLMENVRGLLSSGLRHRPIAERPDKGGPALETDEEPGSVVRLFADDLQKIPGAAYHMDCFEVNAVNYGAPQLRERALFVGNRYNAVVAFPDPTHGPIDSKADTRQQSFFGSGVEGSRVREPWKTLGDALSGVSEDNPTILDFSPRKKSFLSMVPAGSNWRSLPEDTQRESMGSAWFAKGGRSGWWRRLSFALPCPTLVTMPNHASTSLCHPTEVRALSLHEYKLIQEFPEDWEVCGRVSEQYAQIGNAVPVRLGQVAGNVIAEQLMALEARNWEPYPDKPGPYRIVYVQSHVRTRQWFKDGETFIWQDGEDNERASYGAPKTRRKTTTM